MTLTSGESLPALVSRRPWHVGAAALSAGLVLASAPRAAVFAVAALALAGLAAGGTRGLAAATAGLVLLGAAVGSVRLAAIDRPAGMVVDGRHVRLAADVLTHPRASAFGSSIEIRVGGGRLAGARLLVRVPRWTRLPATRPGDRLMLEGSLRALASASASAPASRGTADAAREYDDVLRRRGVAGELFLAGARATGRRRGGIAGVLDRLRARAERGVAAGLPAREAALARGMVLGQDEDIDTGTRDDFRDSGLAHLLAVSGQNVMLLVALAVPPLALLGFGPRSRGIALLGLVALYVPLAGAGPSLQRAGVMGAAGIAALSMSRPASRWYALLLAGAVTLVLNPRAWQDPGWQLSFAAVAGILLLGVPLGRALANAGDSLLAGSNGSRALTRRVVRGISEGVAISIAATLATAPLLALHFHSVPLAGLPANLLALPAVAPAMWLGMVKATLGFLSPVLPPADALAELLGPLVRLPIAYLTMLAERFADVPGGTLDVPIRGPGLLAFAYAALLLGALGLREVARRASDRGVVAAAGWRRRASRRRAMTVAAVGGLLAVLIVQAGTPDPPHALTVSFLDVGQGDATLIQHPDGTAVLFDGGPPEGRIERLLRRAGVDRLALVVATHPSRDHQGGLPGVIAHRPVGLLLNGGDGTSDPGFLSVLRAARSRGVRVVPAIAPLVLRAGALRIRVLSPPPRPPGPPPDDPNPRGVVAIVSCDGFDLLLSADAESEALLPLDLPDVDAMKVPHHGSADPGLPAVLRRLRPEVAGIEVGPNTYGHPRPSTLAALRRANVRTYRTDRDGTVTLTIEGGEMRVATEQ